MAVKVIPENKDDQELIIDVIKHVRVQRCTPETLCQLQKIIETKYYYWWIMDMKKEEYALELFTEDFRYYYNGCLVPYSGERQAKVSKWVNAPMTTTHMGHQPLVWLMDKNHARGVFQYEDHHAYKEDGCVVETWMIYCDDFIKDDNGVWRIQTMRMCQRKADGRFRNPFPPEGWEPEEWEKI